MTVEIALLWSVSFRFKSSASVFRLLLHTNDITCCFIGHTWCIISRVYNAATALTKSNSRDTHYKSPGHVNKNHPLQKNISTLSKFCKLSIIFHECWPTIYNRSTLVQDNKKFTYLFIYLPNFILIRIIIRKLL